MANVPPDAGVPRPAAVVNYRGTELPAHFGDPGAEYERVLSGAGLFDRADRGLLVVTGHDRRSWLHNLVTNTVRDLDDDAGVYAFALDVKGRIQFDVNILCVPGALWLDLDKAALPAARAHLEHYLITEDVQLRDASGESARLGCAGPRAPEIAARLGIPQLAAWPALTCRPVPPDSALADGSGGWWPLRHDFAGLPGFELIVPPAAVAQAWQRLHAAGAEPAGFLVLDALRIEAGIPWPSELDDEVLPLETDQAARAISFHKGCYLGQEIVERMRARGVRARRLVRPALPPGPALPLPAQLRQHGATVGRITSLVNHPVRQFRIGLGYLRTSVLAPLDMTAGDPPLDVWFAAGRDD